MARVICPFCEQDIKLSEQLRVGAKVSCPYCAEKLIVMRLDPVELGWPEADDWEDDEVAWKNQTMQVSSKRVYDPRDSHWYEDADWAVEGADGKMKGKRPKKKRSYDQRDVRRRRDRRDESFQDF